MKLAVKVSSKASRNAVLGWHAERLRISVTAAPERGKANAAVQALLAETLGLPKSAVVLVQGLSTTHKVFDIHGLSEAELCARLTASRR